jgi:ubiquinone/menaquinone biosynthesis C-methylase UbiE
MAAEFKVRDALRPRGNILEEVGIKPGYRVLDYGCGPGGYILPVSKLVGEEGRVYALDILQDAVGMVEELIKKNHLKNVQTILSSCATGLPDQSLDVVLLYDTSHDLDDQNAVLQELHRVLKPNGILSFSDHHMKEPDIESSVTTTGLFKLQKKGKHTYTFLRS